MVEFPSLVQFTVEFQYDFVQSETLQCLNVLQLNYKGMVLAAKQDAKAHTITSRTNLPGLDLGVHLGSPQKTT